MKHDSELFQHMNVDKNDKCYGYWRGHILPTTKTRDILIHVVPQKRCAALLKVMFKQIQNSINKKLCTKRLISDAEMADIVKTMEEFKPNDLQALKTRRYPIQNFQTAMKLVNTDK